MEHTIDGRRCEAKVALPKVCSSCWRPRSSQPYTEQGTAADLGLFGALSAAAGPQQQQHTEQ
jgi:hypothetical protein